MPPQASTSESPPPHTMFEKIWRRHVVVDRDDGYTLLYIDRHLMHDGSAAGFNLLRERGLKLRRPDRAFATPADGGLGEGVTAKDVILAIIARIGTAGAVGHVIEYAGSAIRGLSIEGRLTVCNMSIEAGGKAGMVAPDDTTIAYLDGRPFAP